jgi:hypothetical protein
MVISVHLSDDIARPGWISPVWSPGKSGNEAGEHKHVFGA